MDTRFRRSGIVAIALSSALGLAACGGNSSADDSVSNAGVQTFGSGCAAVPTTGPGSFNGMASAPVASAASANPTLSTLVTAIKKARLANTLNSERAVTVFAPSNDAFGKIPPKTLRAVLADKKLLIKVLTYHVVDGKLTPGQLAGTHHTLEGDDLRISGSDPDFVIGTQKASIVCGNVPTANATVYIVDTVLMPPN